MGLHARIALAILTVGVVHGCSDQGPEDLLLDQLDAARDLWIRSRPDRYAYEIEHVCDCPAAESGPVRVVVRADTVLSRSYRSGDAVPAELAGLFPSVDQLFGLIDSAIRGGAYEVRATYDVDSGVPLTVRIDYEVLEFGEELTYRTVAVPAPVAATLAPASGV